MIGTERKYKNMVSMGMGDKSIVECFRLCERMYEMFWVLGGIQQPPSIHEKPCKQDEIEREEDRLVIEDFVRDVAMFFTGKEIKFK